MTRGQSDRQNNSDPRVLRCDPLYTAGGTVMLRLLTSTSCSPLFSPFHPIRTIHSIFGGAEVLAADHARQFLRAWASAADGALRHLYWGASALAHRRSAGAGHTQRHLVLRSRGRCSRTKSIPGWGGPRYYEPALKITRGRRQSRPGAALRRRTASRERARYRAERYPRRHRGHAALPRLSGPRHAAAQRDHSQRPRAQPLRSRARSRRHGICRPAKDTS